MARAARQRSQQMLAHQQRQKCGTAHVAKHTKCKQQTRILRVAIEKHLDSLSPHKTPCYLASLKKKRWSLFGLTIRSFVYKEINDRMYLLLWVLRVWLNMLWSRASGLFSTLLQEPDKTNHTYAHKQGNKAGCETSDFWRHCWSAFSSLKNEQQWEGLFITAGGTFSYSGA